MSTFSGRIRECDWLSVDQFRGENLTSTAFFLSHCHEDHMVGLRDDAFYNLLAENGYNLYCHPITKIFLEGSSKYSRLANFIIAKDYGEMFTVTMPQKIDMNDTVKRESAVTINVTFMDARHCPGSVMILFEFDGGKRALYTGDIRLSKEDWLGCEPLRDASSGTGFKRIDSFYFDSTFCRKGTEAIPSKEQSKALFLKLVSEWLDTNSNHKVLIWGTSYGQEFLLRAVWEALGIKCHVSAEKYKIYSKIPEFAEYVTVIANSTRVHACTTGINAMDECYEERHQSIVKTTRRKYKPQVFPCGLCRPDNKMVRVIRPSVIWFARRNEKDALGYQHNYFCRLLYSNHCSFTEIEEAFKLLRPVEAFPNVIDKKKELEHVERIMKYLGRYLLNAVVNSRLEGDFKPNLSKRLHSTDSTQSVDVKVGDKALITAKVKRCFKQEVDGIKIEASEVSLVVKEELQSDSGKLSGEPCHVIKAEVELIEVEDSPSAEDGEPQLERSSQKTIELSDGE